MRVSKVMRDYIQEQVYAKFQPRINELKAQADKEEKEFQDTVNDIVTKAELEAREVLKESPVEYNGLANIIQARFYGLRHPLQDEIHVLRDKANETTKTIIVELELGGNKQTLERLLAEIEI